MQGCKDSAKLCTEKGTEVSLGEDIPLWLSLFMI